MSRKLRINNFRGFVNQDFDLSRVNIFIGENSSGKSSFLKFLLALKQTIEEPEISNLILNGNLVDLGNFRESVFYHEEDRKIKFSFSFGEEMIDYYKYFFDHVDSLLDIIKPFIESNTEMEFQLEKDLTDHSNIITKFHNEYLGDLSINLKENKSETLLGESPKCDLIYKSFQEKKLYILEDLGYEPKGFLSIVTSDDLRVRIKEKDYPPNLFYEIAYFLLNQNFLEFFLRNLSYLNPLDSKPQRIYFKKDAQSKYKENNLDKFANMVTNNTIDKKLLSEFSKVLVNFGIVDNLKFSISKNFPVAEIKVKIKDLLSNIYDVGYGVSLQIPLLFETFISEKNYGNTFLIEQPEVHLHPKLQAKFIDSLLSMGVNNKYIIETHSEHIIRMLQVLVKEKKYKLKSEDIRIYYFKRGENSFDIEEFSILESGQLDKIFPSGFYDSSYILTKSLMF